LVCSHGDQGDLPRPRGIETRVTVLGDIVSFD